MPIRRRRRAWPGDGVSAFPADPRLSALDAPAFWDAAVYPYIVILDAAPRGFAAEPYFDPALSAAFLIGELFNSLVAQPAL
ncbi:hypothetical protein GCM10011393_09220 [Sphingopyxis bauzanensis]|nr:hypothetical protein GCM10011393_09220 [Sphingopyxis bauzanensis]